MTITVDIDDAEWARRASARTIAQLSADACRAVDAGADAHETIGLALSEAWLAGASAACVEISAQLIEQGAQVQMGSR